MVPPAILYSTRSPLLLESQAVADLRQRRPAPLRRRPKLTNALESNRWWERCKGDSCGAGMFHVEHWGARRKTSLFGRRGAVGLTAGYYFNAAQRFRIA